MYRYPTVSVFFNQGLCHINHVTKLAVTCDR